MVFELSECQTVNYQVRSNIVIIQILVPNVIRGQFCSPYVACDAINHKSVFRVSAMETNDPV